MLHALEDQGHLDDVLMTGDKPLSRQARRAHKRVQLVDRAVRFDAESVFRKSLPAHETRFAFVSGFRIDPIQSQSGLVEGLAVHEYYYESMATTPQTNQPSPALIFDTLNAYQRTAALRGAIELDLFTAIDASGSTSADLAIKVKASPRGVRILCDYLVVVGLLTKQGDRYSLTQDSTVFL